MSTVKISPKFQLVVPKEVRQALDLRPGQKFRALALGDRIEFVPLKPLRRMRGFLRGIDTDVPRDEDRV